MLTHIDQLSRFMCCWTSNSPAKDVVIIYALNLYLSNYKTLKWACYDTEEAKLWDVLYYRKCILPYMPFILTLQVN